MTNVRFFTELNYKKNAIICKKYMKKKKCVPGSRHFGIYFDEDKDSWIALHKSFGSEEIDYIELFSWDDVSNLIHDNI